MLVLTRRVDQRILIGDDIVLLVVRIGPNSVRIGIKAPKDKKIIREELKVESEGVNEPEVSGTGCL